MDACGEAFGVRFGETAPSVDFCESSKYSFEIFEGRSEKGSVLTALGFWFVDPKRQR